jgi:TRAP-type uncharacterized transport system substrate-binding protein
MSQFPVDLHGPNQTDALLEVVTQQITLLTFDETDEDILMQLVNALADPRELPKPNSPPPPEPASPHSSQKKAKRAALSRPLHSILAISKASRSASLKTNLKKNS